MTHMTDLDRITLADIAIALRELQADVRDLKGLRGEVRRLSARLATRRRPAATDAPQSSAPPAGARPAGSVLVAAFLREGVRPAPGNKVPARALYTAFVAFCDRYAVAAPSEIVFAAAMRPLLGPSRRALIAGRNVNAYAGIAPAPAMAPSEATRAELAADGAAGPTVLYGLAAIAARLALTEAETRRRIDAGELAVFRVGNAVAFNPDGIDAGAAVAAAADVRCA